MKFQVFLIFLSYSVISKDLCSTKFSDRKNCNKQWTVLVFMSASSDLSTYALMDLYEMEAGYKSRERIAGSTSKTDVLVELRLPGMNNSKRIQIFQADEPYKTKSIEEFKKMRFSDISSPVVSVGNKKSITERFKDFLNWGVENYPSKHYMVVVWGHGYGWISKSFNGMSQGSFLDIPTIGDALMETSEIFLGGKKIDVYLSDACLMQMVEVAYEISLYTDYIVGSSNIQSYVGIPYRRLFYKLNTGRVGENEPYGLALIIPELQRASFNGGGNQYLYDTKAIKTMTMSSLSTSSLNYEFMPKMKDFSKKLYNFLLVDKIASKLILGMARDAVHFRGGAVSIMYFLAYLKYTLTDFYQFKSDALLDLLDSIDVLFITIKKVVLSYQIGTSYYDPGSDFFLSGINGFSLWFPLSKDDYSLRIDEFKKSNFFKVNKYWQKSLDLIYL